MGHADMGTSVGNGGFIDYLMLLEITMLKFVRILQEAYRHISMQATSASGQQTPKIH